MKKTAAKLLVIIVLSAYFFSAIGNHGQADDNNSLIEMYHDETFHEIGK